MFNKAIIELYKLKDENKGNPNITESINEIINNLVQGIAAVTDIIIKTIPINKNLN